MYSESRQHLRVFREFRVISLNHENVDYSGYDLSMGGLAFYGNGQQPLVYGQSLHLRVSAPAMEAYDLEQARVVSLRMTDQGPLYGCDIEQIQAADLMRHYQLIQQAKMPADHLIAHHLVGLKQTKGESRQASAELMQLLLPLNLTLTQLDQGFTQGQSLQESARHDTHQLQDALFDMLEILEGQGPGNQEHLGLVVAQMNALVESLQQTFETQFNALENWRRQVVRLGMMANLLQAKSADQSHANDWQGLLQSYFQQAFDAKERHVMQTMESQGMTAKAVMEDVGQQQQMPLTEKFD